MYNNHLSNYSLTSPIIGSNVVLTLLDTADSISPVRQFNKEDFPEFGGPTMLTDRKRESFGLSKYSLSLVSYRESGTSFSGVMNLVKGLCSIISVLDESNLCGCCLGQDFSREVFSFFGGRSFFILERFEKEQSLRKLFIEQGSVDTEFEPHKLVIGFL